MLFSKWKKKIMSLYEIRLDRIYDVSGHLQWLALFFLLYTIHVRQKAEKWNWFKFMAQLVSSFYSTERSYCADVFNITQSTNVTHNMRQMNKDSFDIFPPFKIKRIKENERNCWKQQFRTFLWNYLTESSEIVLWTVDLDDVLTFWAMWF